MLTPSMEDYLEKIYELMKEKGYARVSDIASLLAVGPSSVTKMIQKLDEHRFVTYEKYRGIILTPRGEQMGKLMKQRHRMLEDFLSMLGIQEETIQQDVEGIEHHVSPHTMQALQDLVLFFRDQESFLEEYMAFRKQLDQWRASETSSIEK